MSDARVDLSARLMPALRYSPHRTLVPDRLVLSGVDHVGLAELRLLGTCSDDGPDAVYAPVERTPELSMIPEADAPMVVHGGLNVSRTLIEVPSAGPEGRPARAVSWWAAVTGLTFHADDDGSVFVDGPEGRIILFDPADKRWQRGGFLPVVHADERKGPGMPRGPDWIPCGRKREYESYATLLDERNAQRLLGTHGRVLDVLVPVLSMIPMIDKRKPTTVINAEELTELQGIRRRRIGSRYTLGWSESAAHRLHRHAKVPHVAVLRFDTPTALSADEVDKAGLQLVKQVDTMFCMSITGLMMNACDTRNAPQRVGASDLVRLRGKAICNAKERKRYAQMSALLALCAIEVRHRRDDGTSENQKLFIPHKEIVLPGGHKVPRVTLNEVLYEEMLRRGHGILIDRRLPSIDLNRYEWEARIDFALAAQWAFGWVRNGYAKGNRLRRTAKMLHKHAGIVSYDFDAERRKRGVTAVRQRIGATLDRLVKLRLDLKSWKRVKQADDPADDLYEFVPSDALSTRLTALRQPALARTKPVRGRKRSPSQTGVLMGSRQAS